MGFFKDLPAPVAPRPATLDELLNQANDTADLAIAAFSRAAENLEYAAERLDGIALESEQKADIHAKRAEQADKAAAKHRARAEKIRNLLA